MTSDKTYVATIHIYLSVMTIGLMIFGTSAAASTPVVQPKIITEKVRHDSDDPAIWIDRKDPSRSLVLGTDKDADGALFAFGLDGKVLPELTIRGLLRPNNVDVAYGVMLGGKKIDIAVVTERYAHRLRIFSLPDMRPVDGGGINVFEGERARDVMGVALYTRPSDGAVFAIVSRSSQFAPQSGYLHQYRLIDDGTGTLRGIKVRAFGNWSGLKEIEALSVDAASGLVFASDETYGIREYRADPAAENADEELSEFGLKGFVRDQEGSAVFQEPSGNTLLLVSDQQAGALRVFDLKTRSAAKESYRLVGRVQITAKETDGIDLTSTPLPGFPNGLLVAMSADRTFHLYDLGEILRAIRP